MAYVFLAIVLFIISVIAHVLFCRNNSKQVLHAKAFVLMALFFLFAYLIFIFIIQDLNWMDPHSLWGLPLKVTAGFIYILLVPLYLCFYVLTQLTSPSKKILLVISQNGTLSRQDIIAAVEKEDFIISRLNDLCVSGCVSQNNGRYVLTVEGQKIALVLSFMQGLLGREAGG